MHGNFPLFIAGAPMLVFTAKMPSTGMFVLVMGTMYFRIIVQVAGYIILHCFVCISTYTAHQLDSGCCKCSLCATADTAADQDLNACIRQK